MATIIYYRDKNCCFNHNHEGDLCAECAAFHEAQKKKFKGQPPVANEVGEADELTLNSIFGPPIDPASSEADSDLDRMFGPVMNEREDGEPDEDDTLPIPTLNYSEIAEGNRSKRPQPKPAPVIANSDDDEPDEDDVLPIPTLNYREIANENSKRKEMSRA